MVGEEFAACVNLFRQVLCMCEAVLSIGTLVKSFHVPIMDEFTTIYECPR